MKKIKNKIVKENQNEVEEAEYSNWQADLNLEQLTKMTDAITNAGAKKLRCIEIVPGKDRVVMNMLNIINVEFSASLAHPSIPQGAVTRIAINVTDDPAFECFTIEKFNEVMEFLKEKVEEQNRANVVITINFKSSLDPKKTHEKIYKNTRYYYDDEHDFFYFGVGYPTFQYIKKFIADNPEAMTTDKPISYTISKDSAEKEGTNKLF